MQLRGALIGWREVLLVPVPGSPGEGLSTWSQVSETVAELIQVRQGRTPQRLNLGVVGLSCGRREVRISVGDDSELRLEK